MVLIYHHPMVIPFDKLNPETLNAIIEQFVLAEGTDYGENTYSLEQKVASVRTQLKNGTAILVYSESDDTVNIIAQHDYEALGVD